MITYSGWAYLWGVLEEDSVCQREGRGREDHVLREYRRWTRLGRLPNPPRRPRLSRAGYEESGRAGWRGAGGIAAGRRRPGRRTDRSPREPVRDRRRRSALRGEANDLQDGYALRIGLERGPGGLEGIRLRAPRHGAL